MLPSSSEYLQNATTRNRRILTGWPVRPFFLELQARMGRWSSFQVITGESFTNVDLASKNLLSRGLPLNGQAMVTSFGLYYDSTAL